MAFSSVATALVLGFCCKTASSRGCSWWGKKRIRVCVGGEGLPLYCPHPAPGILCNRAVQEALTSYQASLFYF